MTQVARAFLRWKKEGGLQATAGISDEFFGRHLYAATGPEPKRQQGESWEAFQARQRVHEAAVRFAREPLDRFGIDRTRLRGILQGEMKRRGLKTYAWDGRRLTSYGERLQRLNRMTVVVTQ